MDARALRETSLYEFMASYRAFSTENILFPARATPGWLGRRLQSTSSVKLMQFDPPRW